MQNKKSNNNNSNRPKKLISSASKRAAARKLKEMEDLKATITDVISRSCPTLADDNELCQFLSEELTPYIDDVSKKEDIFTLLEEHIKSFNFNETTSSIMRYCESIFNDLKELSIIILKEEDQQQEDEEDEEEGEEETEDDECEILKDGECPICEREVPLTKHHVIPKETHKWYRKRGYSLEELNRGLDLCRSCHSAIHRFIDNKTLAAEYNTLDALLSHPKVQKWIPYISKKGMFDKSDARTLKPNNFKEIPDSFSDED